MPHMVPNELLERATKDPSILTPEEVRALVAEVIRDRKFIKSIKIAESLVVDLPVAKNQTFYREILAVSSGTLSVLTGVRDYTALSKIETAFAKFYLYHQDAKYDSWMDVWRAFVASPEGLTA